MKELIALLRDGFALLREAAILAIVLLVAVNPGGVGRWLVRHGVDEIKWGDNRISLQTYKDAVKALDAVSKAAETTPDSPAKSALQSIQGELTASLADQARTLARQRPGELPRSGWIYLGTLDAARSAWRAGVQPTVQNTWPFRVGDALTLSTATNLRADTEPDARPSGRILSVLPARTRVEVKELDDHRPVPATDRAAPGVRLWARVDVLADD